jgi:hypothetical protein
MTSYVQARDSIVSLIHTNIELNLPTLPVFWENTLSVNLDTVGDRLLRVEIDFDDAKQMTINDAPERRVYGEVVFTLMNKVGLGTRDTLVVIDYIENVVKYVNTTKVVFQTPAMGRKQERQGWVSHEFRAPFFFDSMAWDT